MQIPVLAILLLTVSGCAAADCAGPVLDRLSRDATPHAAALAGNDVALMRSTGLDLISEIDAAQRRD